MSRQKEVIRIFKTLHRTVDTVFRNDIKALAAARERINGDFKKNKAVSSETAVNELINFAVDCDKVLREQVIQVQLQPKTGRYRANIRPEVHMFENSPFRDDVTEQMYKQANKRGKKKCDEASNGDSK